MLRSLKELKGYVLNAADGEVGRCRDFLLDDQDWAIRYMVADTRKWLPGRLVVISPIALGEPDWEKQLFPVRMTKKQIESAPSLDEHAPVTREYEIWYHKHFSWPYYWSGSGLWASGIHPRSLYVEPSLQAAQDVGDLGEEGPDLEHPHLHSADEIIKYGIGARDGEIGHVEDFILDDENWSVRHVVAATRNWLPGKHVLIPMARLESVAWDDETLVVDLTRDQIKDSPDYDPHTPVNREFEEKTYDFVGRPHEWR